MKNKMVIKIFSLLAASALIMTQVSDCTVYAKEDAAIEEAANAAKEAAKKGKTVNAEEIEKTGETAGKIAQGEETGVISREADVTVTAQSKKETVAVSTADELAAVAAKCDIDNWSANKRIELQEDISLADYDFEPIQIFAGTFNGNGHTISGFHYKGSGYADGFFRYITQTGIVQDLTVTGIIEAENEKDCTGGICGVNGGWILNCTFRGRVEGKSETGGIAGENESSGTINSCSVYGSVTGYDRAGGMAGANYGMIRNCKNMAGINSDSSWLEDKDEAGLEWLLEEVSEKKLVSGTDIGGIAGYSKGIIANCTNTGVVGYEHNGYNIGGIVGRQSGQVASCSNNGSVYGRKDVGGIVGQMEPYISVEEAESISEAVQRLHNLVDQFLEDASDTQDTVSADFNVLRTHADLALSNADSIAGQTTEFIDKNVAAVNEVGNRVGYIMDRLPYVLEDVNKAVDKMNKAADDLKKVADALKSANKVGDETYDETKYVRLSLVSGVGGNVYADKAAPAEGEEVRLTITPDKGYKVSYIAATDAKKNNVALTEAESAYEGSNEYTFTMPAENVVVKAEFAAVNSGEAGNPEAAFVKYVGADAPSKKDEGNMANVSATSNKAGASGSAEMADKAGVPDATTAAGGKPGASNTAGMTEESGAANTADKEEVSDTSDTASAEDKPDASDMTSAEDKQGASDTTSAEDKPDAPDMTSAADKQGASDTTDTTEKSDTSDTTNMTDVSDTKIIIESNAGGKADYSISGTVVTLTLRPNSGYMVADAPAVTDGEGNQISTSKQGADSNVYTFNIDGVVQPVRVKITFVPNTASGAVSDSWSDLGKNIALLQTQMQNISNIMANINKLMEGKDIKDFTKEDAARLTEYMVELAGALSDAGAALSSVLGDLTTLSDIMPPYIEDALKKAGVEMNHLIEDLKSVFSYLDSAFGLLRSTILYLNGKFDIQFAKLGDGMHTSINGLFDELEAISSYAGRINNDLSAHSDILEADLHAINDQINTIFQLFVQRLEDVEDLYYEESGYEDVSDEDIDENSDGKVERSINSGIVKGDINVGGIAGSMAIDEEDPEGNAAGSVHYSFGSRYLTKCIIDRCKNDGNITAKKDGVGCIAGYMNLGIIANSEAYGSAESTDGEYVGGVSGESLALIKNCCSLASLKGSGYIGGIAGSGRKIQDCYSMALINAAAIRKGAIAGWIETGEDERLDYGDDIYGNFFVSNELRGIDEVSYAGIAEPVTYEEILRMDGITSQFRHLQLTFVADDNVVERMEVEYGKPLSEIEFPNAPYVEGSYGKWPEVTNMSMDGNITLRAEYYDNITTLSSAEALSSEDEAYDGASDKPYAYIDGIYTDDAVLNVSKEEKTAQETKSGIGKNAKSVIYGITVENGGLSGEAVSKVRIYNPYEKVKTVMEKVGESWEDISYKEYGRYIQVDMEGDAGTYCIISGDGNYGFIVWIAGAAAILLLAVIIIRRRSRALT